ncbi:MAG: hypothetical protein KDA73_05180 [Rhodobacteraceae bacterium]|nr:hypothetical protein [Paracoccaceae bacterium]
MRPEEFAVLISVLAAAGAVAPVTAQTMRSTASVSTAEQQPADQQPKDGVAVTYPVTLSGGDLDGCVAQIHENLFPRDDGAWGIYQVATDLGCENGGFKFVSAGAWDGSGFHGSGVVVPDSGTGDFEGLAARIAQIGGGLTPIEGTKDLQIKYELIVDPVVE